MPSWYRIWNAGRAAVGQNRRGRQVRGKIAELSAAGKAVACQALMQEGGPGVLPRAAIFSDLVGRVERYVHRGLRIVIRVQRIRIGECAVLRRQLKHRFAAGDRRRIEGDGGDSEIEERIPKWRDQVPMVIMKARAIVAGCLLLPPGDGRASKCVQTA